jgi:hypothetical protein
MKSPSPPDPYKTAQAQGAANREAAEASAIIGNVNEKNPYGTVNYNKIGEEMVNGKPVSRYERVTALSPEQQNLLNLQNKMQGNLGQLGVSQSSRLQGLLGTNLSTEGLPDWQKFAAAPSLKSSFGGNNPMAMTLGNYGDVRQDSGPTDRAGIESAMLGRYRENAARERSAQDAALAARGLNPGSAQYTDISGARNRQDVDAYQQAYLASGSEARAAQDAYNQAQQQRFAQGATGAQFQNEAQRQAYEQALQRAGFSNEAITNQFNLANAAVSNANNLRGLMFQERQGLRNAPINEIASLMSGSQVTVPQFQGYNAPSVASVPIGDYINQNYQARLANAQNRMSGIFGLGSSLLGGVMGM